jgi:pimeloyl-ACP methyl ester carboxylesterase
MDGTGTLFAPLISELGPNVSTVVVRYADRPQDYAAHETTALSALPEGQTYVLLGESFSGPIAISIAARSPPRLLGYILCCSFLTCPRRVLRLMRPLLGFLPPQRVPDALAAHFLMGRFATAELHELHAGALKQMSPETLVARLKAIAYVDVRDKVARASVPGLYLRATEDRMVPGSAATTFAKLAANGMIVDVEGPHFLLQSNPAKAARIITTFIDNAAKVMRPWTPSAAQGDPSS